jgi:hypothetical protein
MGYSHTRQGCLIIVRYTIQIIQGCGLGQTVVRIQHRVVRDDLCETFGFHRHPECGYVPQVHTCTGSGIVSSARIDAG